MIVNRETMQQSKEMFIKNAKKKYHEMRDTYELSNIRREKYGTGKKTTSRYHTRNLYVYTHRPGFCNGYLRVRCVVRRLAGNVS